MQTESMKSPSNFSILKQMLFEGMCPGQARPSDDRIDWLLRKAHTVGSITIPIPNLVAFQLISKLKRDDTAAWLLEVLYILANQKNEDALFLRGDERKIAIAQHARDILATDLPNYMVAVMETLAAVEKKSQRYSNNLTKMAREIETEMSHLASSPLPKQPDNPSDTSQPN